MLINAADREDIFNASTNILFAFSVCVYAKGEWRNSPHFLAVTFALVEMQRMIPLGLAVKPNREARITNITAPVAMPVTFDGQRAVPTPEVTRLMLELLNLKPTDKVMEIGTGSGYQTKELAKSGAEIHSIEMEPWVDVVSEGNVYLHHGDARVGLPGFAPFDAIMATCGVEEIPRAWKEQLAEGGRLVVPLGFVHSQRLTLFVKEDGMLVPKQIAAYVKFQMMRAPSETKPIKPRYEDRPSE